MSTDSPTPAQSIARLARDVKGAANRAQAFEALQRIVGGQDWGTIDNRGEALHDLARLYAHFLPKPTIKPTTTFQWVAKAIGQNDQREYLNFVYVTEDHIVGTDGHSLHMAPNVLQREPGYYNTAGDYVEPPTWRKYADFMRVIPSPNREGREWVDVTLADLELTTEAHANKIRSAYLLPSSVGVWPEPRLPRHPEPTPVAAHLIDRLFSMDRTEVVGANVGGRKDVILFKLSDDRQAVVMPLL